MKIEAGKTYLLTHKNTIQMAADVPDSDGELFRYSKFVDITQKCICVVENVDGEWIYIKGLSGQIIGQMCVNIEDIENAEQLNP